MEQLPDDVLAMAMSHLPVKDLLACRLVCKRLAGLAQHPDVWRHRSIDIGIGTSVVDGGSSMSCQELRLAPCARRIWTSVPEQPLAPCRHDDLRTTSCAASELAITVWDFGLEHVAKAVRIVQQQVALGRLRGLSLVLSKRSVVLLEDAVDLLFGTLASTPGLEMASLGGRLGDGTRIPHGTGQRGTITPSLKTFRCTMTPRPEPFCDYMLAGHAATLEVVHFGHSEGLSGARFAAPLASTSSARLLAGMPNLRVLSCPLMPGLGEVAACESLRELRLTVGRDTEAEDDGHGALELLRGAHQIRSLHLHFPSSHDADDDESDDEEFGAELISELASSGRSQVETLSIDVVDLYCQSLLLSHLTVRMPSLPALRNLVLRVVDPDPLVDLISPLTAPSLRSIQILDDYSLSRMCSHKFLHSWGLGGLLSRNPLLHVEVEYVCCPTLEDNAVDLYEDVKRCNACQLNCHIELKDGVGGCPEVLVGVFAHPTGKCPSPEDHTSKCHWIHINDVQQPQ